MTKSLLYAFVASAFLTGCSGGYFSKYETVYRIETSNGDHYYSENKPKLSDKESYKLEDLDGNEHQIKKDSIYKIEKYRYRK